MLRVVEIDELQLLQTQQAQATLNAAPHLRAGKDARLHIAVGLRRQHKVRRKLAQLTEHDPNAALALTITIRGGGIQEVEWTGEKSANRGPGALLRDCIGEGP